MNKFLKPFINIICCNTDSIMIKSKDIDFLDQLKFTNDDNNIISNIGLVRSEDWKTKGHYYLDNFEDRQSESFTPVEWITYNETDVLNFDVFLYL
jgi:hypothetical protein